MYCCLSYGHYLLTRCPVSPLPDFGTVTLETDGFVEILAWRKMVGSYSGQKIFAEDLAVSILEGTQHMVGKKVIRLGITYRRMFGRLTVKVGDMW